jgi:hypothetical protein
VERREGMERLRRAVAAWDRRKQEADAIMVAWVATVTPRGSDAALSMKAGRAHELVRLARDEVVAAADALVKKPRPKSRHP